MKRYSIRRPPFITPREGYNGEDSLYSFCNGVMLGFSHAGRGDENPKFSFGMGKGATGGTGELGKDGPNLTNRL